MSAARDERPDDTPADQRYDALIAQLRAVSPEIEELVIALDDVVGDRLGHLHAEEVALAEEDVATFHTSMVMIGVAVAVAAAQDEDYFERVQFAFASQRMTLTR